VAGTDERDGAAVGVDPTMSTEVSAGATEILPGDDITIITDAPAVESGHRRRVLLGVAALVIVLALVAVIALTRDDTKPTAVRTTPVVGPPPLAPSREQTTPKPARKPAAKPRTKQTAAAATTPQTQAPVTAPPNTVPVSAVVPPPTTPKQYPTSALTWTAPSTLTIKYGTQKTISVTAHNPTDGTVTLPHPLSCAPTLDGSGVCAEMAQLIAPGASAHADYVIDAHYVAPGAYTLNVEGVWKIAVTVTS
jgi:hypothetical protein